VGAGVGYASRDRLTLMDVAKERLVRLVVGISGASGAIYGARLVETLAALKGVAVELVMSKGARATLAYETDYDPEALEQLADVVHDERNLGASIASGTYRVDGMVVAPCSIRTLSGIANSNNDNLLVRAADVCLKERRRLVLVVRETPLHIGHLRLMTWVSEAGAVILPPVPGFYVRPTGIDDIVNHTIMKIMDQFDLDAGVLPRWSGIQ
jgi:4-hydroxy-3-polyprenylbenzoate decarboxylase